ncbi:MAG: hypothetical protein RLZZ305_1740 [Actinomycetota bacterium]
MALVVFGCLAVGRTAVQVLERARTSNIAEGAALAVAVSGTGDARLLAAAQGARIESVDDNGSTVSVTVLVDGRTATAHARRVTVPAGEPAVP